LADQAIQDIFKNGEVIVQDHYRVGESSMQLVNILSQRLILEHNISGAQIIKKYLGYGRWKVGLKHFIETPPKRSLKYKIKQAFSLLVLKVLYLISKITK